MNTPNADHCFKSLGKPNHIWAVSAVHGHAEALTGLHDAILEHVSPGDRIVYLGNYTGYGEHSAAVIDELLTFRRLVLSIPGMKCDDIVYLRGQQEEMWQKLLQIQFSPNPADILLWMLGNGLSNTLHSYGISPHDGIEACGYGVMGLTKWTNKIREMVRRHPGHEVFCNHIKRAAYTAQETQYPMLFVHAGIDARKALNDQGDNFWWAASEFEKIESPYLPFEKVIRGYDPGHRGVKMNCVTATIDGGCGFGGNLICAGFGQDGQVADILEA